MAFEKAQALYLDPAWKFRVWDKDTGSGRSAESHYRTMATEDMAKLPVPDLLARNCAVFMWSTYTHLPDALLLGKAWGLEYKTVAFTWVKTNKRAEWHWNWTNASTWFMGMGYWTRANPEVCLLFTKGSPKRKAKNVRNLIVAPIGRHSAKPVEIYERIEALVDGPYLEMFCRTPREGWSAWGNEIDSTPEVKAVLERGEVA